MSALPAKAHWLNFNCFDSRKNFPDHIARKRGESNFMRAFERVYTAQHKQHGIVASEFALQYFGRADLIWIPWSPDNLSEDFSAIALYKQLWRRKLIAFEGTLKDWKKGLQQGYRYRYFADKSILVMPVESIRPALSNLPQFQRLEVGLWAFDKQSGKITEHFSPNRAKAMSTDARQAAISLISRKINLRKVRKHVNSVTERV
jgi:hypothetical protein